MRILIRDIYYYKDGGEYSGLYQLYRRKAYGMIFYSDKTIVIRSDIADKPFSFVSTLIHELIHYAIFKIIAPAKLCIKIQELWDKMDAYPYNLEMKIIDWNIRHKARGWKKVTVKYL
jgi:hypothetical protein